MKIKLKMKRGHNKFDCATSEILWMPDVFQKKTKSHNSQKFVNGLILDIDAIMEINRNQIWIIQTVK
jgi:hypothetical protein